MMSSLRRPNWSSVLHHDFCPWANAYVYWLKRPLGWVFLAGVASVLLGLMVSPQAFLATGVVLAVGGIGAAWPWISMLGVRGEIAWHPRRCEEGETIDTVLTITNRWPWPSWGLRIHADDEVSERVEAPDQPISLSRISGWTRSRYSWRCRPATRGVYPKKRIRVSSAFPFGIGSAETELHVAHPLVVWPRIVRLSDVPEHSGPARLGVGSTSPRVGDEGDWMGVRPYRPGDALRQVHWAQTARRDSLMVFERQARSRQTVAIRLDGSAALHASPRERDWMVRIAASVACHFLSHAWDVRFGWGDRWQPLHASGRSLWLDQLATWDPSVDGEEPRGTHSAFQPGMSLVVSHVDSNAPARDCLEETSLLIASQDHRPFSRRYSSAAKVIDVGPHRSVVEVEEDIRHAWRQICQGGVTHGARSAS